ncbi:hypothetical protein [Porphyromonas endodontalis]|uniref:hypothetical protein n=1 Tax=Porphyromonas endodontalis TaxID=28124 RepID=UPI0028EC3AB2|nr:hypothetical protein [Porphyromonas endodontalis]
MALRSLLIASAAEPVCRRTPEKSVSKPLSICDRSAVGIGCPPPREACMPLSVALSTATPEVELLARREIKGGSTELVEGISVGSPLYAFRITKSAIRSASRS